MHTLQETVGHCLFGCCTDRPTTNTFVDDDITVSGLQGG